MDANKRQQLENMYGTEGAQYAKEDAEATVTVHKSRAVGISETPMEELQKRVNDAVAEAGSVKTLTPKQAEKQRKQEAAYWKGMISREEARSLVLAATEQQNEKLRMLYITTNTVLAIIKEKGLATEDEINQASLPFIELMYGKKPEPQNKKEEGADGDVQEASATDSDVCDSGNDTSVGTE